MIVNKFLPILFREICHRQYSTVPSGAALTALYEFHVKNGGKMVNFGGFMLPVQYNDLSISASHLHTRKNASLFDVSHMLQTEIKGKGVLDYFQSICTADLHQMQKGVATLTVFTDEKGGILDDLIVTKIDDDHLYVVSNAAMKNSDKKHMQYAKAKYETENPSHKIHLKFFDPDERSLLAIQGPKAAEILQKLTDTDLNNLYFMRSVAGSVAGVGTCRITRCGYTGEDGFEISIPSIKAVDVANALIREDPMKLAGLGARDSLRLEAGLCLYGNDISAKTTPAQAGLMWLISKSRRNNSDYPGAQEIQGQLDAGLKVKRVGLIAPKGPPARHDTEIYCNEEENSPIGMVTSGCPSPSLKTNIAMGYVPVEYSRPGTKLLCKIRDKMYDAIVTKMPFVKTNYYVKPK